MTMIVNEYKKLPQTPVSDVDDNDSVTQVEDPTPEQEPDPDPRFDQPTPSPYKRGALLLFIALLFWLSYAVRPHGGKQAKVVHATRYSKEHKFRPAASPIVSETLRDGRVKVRGAAPTSSSVPEPSQVVKAKRRAARKASGKAGRGKTKKRTKRG